MSLVPIEPQRPAWIELMGPAGELAGKISETEFVPVRLRKRPAAVMACILSGQEARIGPMQALRQIFVTDDGKVGMAAELMRSLVLRDGHEIWPEDYSNTRVTMAGRRRGNPDANPTRVTWTMDDAKKAGLGAKQNWTKYPRAMLTARATTELCRLVFPDVIAGISYSLEELEDGDVDTPPPADTNGTNPEAKKTVTRKATRRAAPAPKEVTTPPAPPLPDEDPAPADDGMPVDRKIAMRAREVGVDHHKLIQAVTNMKKSSGKELTGAEAAEVLDSIRLIKEGHLRLLADGDRFPVLEEISEDDVVDAEVVEDGPPLPDEIAPLPESIEQWDADTWREFLSRKGVKVSDALREAQRIAPDLGVVAPVSLDQLSQRHRVGTVIRDYVDSFGRDEA